MEVRIEQKPELKIAGPLAVTKTADSDTIKRLWASLEKIQEDIACKKSDTGYEMHIELEKNLHYCLTGIEVEEVKSLPLNCFVKTIPPGEYAVFSFKIASCGYKKAYEQMNEWLKENIPPGSEAHKQFEVQVYDHRFRGMEDPESIIDFLVPLF